MDWKPSPHIVKETKPTHCKTFDCDDKGWWVKGTNLSQDHILVLKLCETSFVAHKVRNNQTARNLYHKTIKTFKTLIQEVCL